MRWFVVIMLMSMALILVGSVGDLYAQGDRQISDGSNFSSDISAVKYPVIRSRSMSIRYEISAAARQHLTRVELWYAHGEQGGWQLYDYDADRVSPMNFISPGEGVYRFLVVAVDRWGRRSYRVGNQTASYQNSSPIPPVQVEAQQVVFVDYTAPKLYLYSPRSEILNYQHDRLRVRWQGFDSFLDSKPMRLYFSEAGRDEWIAISPPLPIDGQFDWDIPARLEGGVRIRAVMTDRAGNVDIQTSGLIHLARKADSTRSVDQVFSDSEKPFEYQFMDPTVPNVALEYAQVSSDLPGQARQIEAQRAFRRGRLHSQRFEWPSAIQAFQETLAADPSALEAKINLANVYFRTGQFENTLEYYELVLQEEPSRNNALFGLAQTQRALNQYGKALATLELLLKQDRLDYQAWRMHAEAAEKTGQYDVAKSSWQQALRSPFQPIHQLAQEKLAQMN